MRVLVGLERERKDASGEMDLCDIADILYNIDLTHTGNLIRILVQ
jgi:hypothetical protein